MCKFKDTFAKDAQAEKAQREDKKHQRRVLQDSAIYVSDNLQGASKDLKDNVLPHVRLDDVGDILKTDTLILKVGSKLRSNHRESHLKTHITQKMRELGKLVLKMKKYDGQVKDFKDCLRSKNIPILFKAKQEQAGFDESTGKVEIPSVPGRLKAAVGLALETIKNDIRSDPALSYDTKQELLFDYQSSQEIIKTDWRYMISTNAQKSLNEQHRNKAAVLPLTKDIKIASEYLTTEETALLTKLKASPDPETFEKMCETLIADLIIFNCRRAGEVSRARLSDYVNRHEIEFDGNLEKVLSEAEIAAKAELAMFYVPGKRDRTVPIIMTNLMNECINLLVVTRDQMNVGNKTLLFPRLYSDRPYDSCKIIRDLKAKLPLEKPEYFTSTGFRHEIATHSHIDDSDRPGYKKVLYSHMGHTKDVHKEKYVTPMPILQLSRVGANLLQRRSKKNLKAGPNDPATSSKYAPTPQSCTEHADSSLDFSVSPDIQVSLPTNQDDDSIQETVTHSNSQSQKNITDYVQCNANKDTQKGSDGDLDFLESAESATSSDEFLKPSPKKKRQNNYNPWTLEQQKVVFVAFKKFFKQGGTPGRALCESLMVENDCLQGRKWQQINAFVDNVNKGRKKVPSQLKYLMK